MKGTRNKSQKEKQKIICAILLSVTFGGGEITALKTLRYLLSVINKLHFTLRIYILLPDRSTPLLERLILDILKSTDKEGRVIVHVYTFSKPLEFLCKYIVLSKRLILDVISAVFKVKVSMLALTCSPENVTLALVLKILLGKLVNMMVITHGSKELVLMSMRMKQAITQKLYSLLQLVGYTLINKLASCIMTFIPYAALSSKYIKVPYPMDLKISCNEQRTLSSKSIILYMGRLYNNVKQWTDAVKAYIEFVQTYGHQLKVVPRFVIAGDGPERHIAKRLAEKSRTIMYLGFVKGETKEKILNKSLILLLPSRIDTYPLVLHEALAHCIPVITYESLWILSVPKEFINKIIFIAQSHSDMARKIYEILQNTDMILRDRKLLTELRLYLKTNFNSNYFALLLSKVLSKYL